ncbi:oligosaccharide flippase family protein [Pseudoalteromonas sp. SMS1]|uniref:oligosaccharide flippase family protein n=1 Tax=Pseudoalteromonas sp. SMS1 TaxID=2908894 RepID=UPI001F4540C6|nr:oligosaccharide flippase family protein [Pseudoalteromonas sp. SMS1]MCF2857427.1 oligosaccharide flippase family protein [Pseudoalteromonas sp. SMS1]
MFKKLSSQDSKVVFQNFLSLLVLRGLDFLIPLLTFPYLLKAIGVEKFGLVNFAIALCVYFSAVVQYGFSVTATRDIARNRSNEQKLSEIYSVTLSCSVFLSIVCLMAYSVIVMSFEKFRVDYELFFLTFLSVITSALFPIWFFQGIEKMKFITYFGLFSKISFLVSLFIFVKEESDYILVPLLNFVFYFISLVLSLFVISKYQKVKFKLVPINRILENLANSKDAFITQFAPNLYTNTSVFLLGIFTNNVTVGVFTAASKVIDALGSLAYVFSNAFLPFISREIKNHKMFSNIMISVGVILAVALLLLSDFIAGLLFADSAKEVVKYMEIMSICIPLIFLNLTFGNNYLMLVDKEAYFKKVVLYTSLLSLSLTFPVVYYFGIYGSIFSLIFTRMVIFIWVYPVYRTDWKKRLDA